MISIALLNYKLSMLNKVTSCLNFPTHSVRRWSALPFECFAIVREIAASAISPENPRLGEQTRTTVDAGSAWSPGQA